jgi:putative ABC transport system permease protein
MLKNIVLVAWRNFRYHKTVTIILIAGLTLGQAAFLLISGYTHYERSYDRTPGNADSIYRVESRFYRNDQLTDDWATSTNGYATAMKKEFQEIADFTRINWNNSERVVRYGTIKYREAHVCFADTNFFQFFRYPLLTGDAARVLKDPNSIVLSATTAKKYFGTADPIGKFLDVNTVGDSYHCVVTGVFADLPGNSTMRFSALVSWSTQKQWQRDFWYIHESYTFVKLAPGVAPAQVEEKFPALAEKYKNGPSLRDLRWAIQLVPLADIHLRPVKQYEIETKGNGRAVRFLEVIAYIILLIASLNYINLTTARAADRAKEVGIRKVSGARFLQLVGQFLVESTLISGIALGAGIWLTAVLRGPLMELLGAGSGVLYDSGLVIRLGLTLVAMILLTGVYPAFVLSRVKPVTILKGRYISSKGGVLLSRAMVIFQFTASLLLLAGVLAVYLQIRYMKSEPKGVATDQTLVLRAPVNTADYKNAMRSMKAALQGLPGVKQVTGSGAVPGKAVGEFLADRRFGASKSEERTYEMLRVDFDFIPTYGLAVLAGRPFDPTRPADSTGIVLNESAVRQLGWESPEEAIGKKVWLETLDQRPNEVIGVVRDYHQQSLQNDYTPVILFMDPALGWIPTRYYSVRIRPGSEQAVTAAAGTLWGRYFPESSYDFFFLDDFYNAQYRQDISFGRIFLLFSSLAIVIACMGLFGLTAHSTRRRTREIGVRKTLGASVPQLLGLLIRESVWLVLGCSVLGLPLAYLFITGWLKNYAFRVELTWWQFGLPVLLLLFIALSTIGVLVWKAARTNPALTLRVEN